MRDFKDRIQRSKTSSLDEVQDWRKYWKKSEIGVFRECLITVNWTDKTETFHKMSPNLVFPSLVG